MKLALALAAILLIGIPPGGQDAVKHAPSIDQCRADQALWDSKLRQVAPGSKDWAHFANDTSVRTITHWDTEMSQCMDIDHERVAAYSRTAELGTLVGGDRATDFIARHNLMGQFLAEDEAGLR